MCASAAALQLLPLLCWAAAAGLASSKNPTCGFPMHAAAGSYGAEIWEIGRLLPEILLSSPRLPVVSQK